MVQIKDRGNSLLIIEHSDVFDSIADRIVYLGPEAGRKGGEIISYNSLKDEKKLKPQFFPKKSEIKIDNEEFNNVIIQGSTIPTGTLVGICGVSGSGKTTFLKNILSRYIKSNIYFDQSSLRGNIYSIVATSINILGDIEQYYADKTKKNIKNFWFGSEAPGQCPYCKGTGVITEKTIGWNSEYECPLCKGKRFSEKALSYKVDDLNIYDFLSLSVNELIKIIPANTSIYNKLKTLIRLGLGYINLFQRTESLSGGECQRIKLAAAIVKNKRPTTLILDEPFRGLDLKNSNQVITYLYELIAKGYSIYLAEHNPYVLSRCSYLVEFGPGSGAKGGRITFVGGVDDIKKEKNSVIAKFLDI